MGDVVFGLEVGRARVDFAVWRRGQVVLPRLQAGVLVAADAQELGCREEEVDAGVQRGRDAVGLGPQHGRAVVVAVSSEAGVEHLARLADGGGEVDPFALSGDFVDALSSQPVADSRAGGRCVWQDSLQFGSIEVFAVVW